MNENELPEKYQFLPEHRPGAMYDYIEHGIEPDAFTLAVLRNDLCGALEEGDDYLFDVVQWLKNNAPSACWGSPEKVEAWMEFKKHGPQL